MLALGLELPRWFWLLVGAVELCAGLLRDEISLQARRIVGGQVANRVDSKISIWTILPRAILSFKAPLLLVASLVGVLGFWLFGYAIYNLATLFGMVVLTLRRALLADRQQSSKGESL